MDGGGVQCMSCLGFRFGWGTWRGGRLAGGGRDCLGARENDHLFLPQPRESGESGTNGETDGKFTLPFSSERDHPLPNIAHL